MKRITRSARVLAACALLCATGANAWDHRAMQSHHAEVARKPHALAPGEVRVGTIEIGVPASASAQVPRTADTDASRPAANAPRIRSGSEGTSGR